MEKASQIFLGSFQIDQIYCGDALELMKGIPDGRIDLVITDPPFAIDFRAKRSNYNPTQERILKESGSMFVFSGWTNLKDILNAIDNVGFITINHLIWKYQFGVFTKRRLVTSHYHILFVAKNENKYKFNKIEHYPEDVWVVKREYWTGKLRRQRNSPSRLLKK